MRFDANPMPYLCRCVSTPTELQRCQDVVRIRFRTKTEPCRPDKSMKSWLMSPLRCGGAHGNVASWHFAAVGGCPLESRLLEGKRTCYAQVALFACDVSHFRRRRRCRVPIRSSS